MAIAPTPKGTIMRDGCAQLYRFRRAKADALAPGAMPLLLVPSMINKWYVLDLRRGASLAAALTGAGLDTFCLDWGTPEDEDRYVTWDDVIARLHRAIRRVKRETGAPRVGLLGYCMGATLAGIATALRPDDVGALVNLAGPFDFAHAGFLGAMVAREHFDVEAMIQAGNITPLQMQSGFVALRPTAQLSKCVALFDRGQDPAFRDAFDTLEGWATDNVPFPAAAYGTYIRELYQENLLMAGEHYVAGQRVELRRITCPVLTVTADRDSICPVAAARGLHDRCGSADRELLVVPGGHVGAVVGSKAPAVLYPAIAKWLVERLSRSRKEASAEAACN